MVGTTGGVLRAGGNSRRGAPRRGFSCTAHCRRRSDRISLPPTRCDFFARPPVRAATFARIVEPRGGGVPSFSMMRIAMRRWRPSRRPWQAAHIEIQHGRKESGRGRSTGIARDDENRIARAFLPLVHRGFGGQPTQRFSDECNRRVLPPHCRGGGGSCPIARSRGIRGISPRVMHAGTGPSRVMHWS